MKKTLIAAGIAAVIAAPAAFADVKVSGGVEQQFSKTENAQWTGGSDNFVTISASEDLGNGLTAFASITLDADKDSDNTAATTSASELVAATTNKMTKDEKVGLTGSFGTVMVGRFEDFTEGKVQSRMTLDSDLGGDGVLEANANAARTDNGMAYVSPTVNGFHIGVGGYVGATTDSTSYDAYDIALFYDNGPLSLAVAQETFKYTAAGESNDKVLSIAASYSMGDLKGTILRTSVDNNGGTAADDRDYMAYRVDYKMGNNSLTLGYNDVEGANGVDGDDVWAFEVGHNFSKRTKVYGAYTSVDSTTAANDVDTLKVGLKHSF